MNIDFTKSNGLIPVIIQDTVTLQVLMLGYMNQEAFELTRMEQRVTFFSRTRNKLWTKGATSGNYLYVREMSLDCDSDTLLIKVRPAGPACHTGTVSCFNEVQKKGFIYTLETVIAERSAGTDNLSYTSRLFRKGINKIAQKVGEEAVEVVIEAKDNNEELFKNEVADLIFHLLVLLRAKNISFMEIEHVLEGRAK